MSRLEQPVVRPRPARVWLAGAVAGALAGGVLAALAVAAPAQAAGIPIPVSCSDNVVLDIDGATYHVTGTCGRVVVKGSDIEVGDLPAAQTLVLRGTGHHVDAKTVDRMVVRGHDHSLTASSVRSLRLISPGTTLAVEGLVEEARVGRDAATLAATQISSLWTRGTGHQVRAGKGYDAHVLGDRADLRFRRLPDVDLEGDRNTVVVRRGTTTVHDAGEANSVRVHRRG